MQVSTHRDILSQTTLAPVPIPVPVPPPVKSISHDYGLGFDLSALNHVDQAVIMLAWTAQQERECVGGCAHVSDDSMCRCLP